MTFLNYYQISLITQKVLRTTFLLVFLKKSNILKYIIYTVQNILKQNKFFRKINKYFKLLKININLKICFISLYRGNIFVIFILDFKSIFKIIIVSLIN